MRLEARTYQFKTKLNRMEKVLNKHQNATDVYTLLCAGFIDVAKREKPEIGSKVLVKIVYKSGEVDYNVAIYAICGYDKRKKGYFQNFEHQLNEGNIMDTDAWEYTRNVKAWLPLACA